MEDWSMLPEDLLYLIGKRLETRWDVTRFRSVCSSWRSSTPPKPCSFPEGFPVYISRFRHIHSFRLSRRTIFLIRLPENGSQWFVKAKEDKDGTMHLINPFSLSQFGVLPSNFPKVLNLSDFQVLELGHDIVVEYDFHQEFRKGSATGPGAWKASLLWLSSESDDFALLLTHIYGKLVIYRSRDKSCTEVEKTPNRQCLAVASFRGKFYAIDDLGRTLVIEPSAKASFLPHVGSPATRKFLVKSGNELLLVDGFLLVDSPTGYYDNKFLQGCLCGSKKLVKFQVYKLDERGQEWVEVQNLGNSVLFLGTCGTFSAAALDISSDHKGNCIIFRDDIFYSTYAEYNRLDGGPVHLFCLEDGSVKPLTNCPSSSSLFWTPPADWITQAAAAGSKKFKVLEHGAAAW